MTRHKDRDSNEENAETVRVREILAKVKSLAVEYYQLTRRPLGVTGEVAEYVAAEHLGLELAPPRTLGYNALRSGERIQIRGRACGEKSNQQKLSRIRRDAGCDAVILVLLGKEKLELREMYEATFEDVLKCLNRRPTSKARARGVLTVGEFKRIAKPIFPAEK